MASDLGECPVLGVVVVNRWMGSNQKQSAITGVNRAPWEHRGLRKRGRGQRPQDPGGGS